MLDIEKKSYTNVFVEIYIGRKFYFHSKMKKNLKVGKFK